MSSIRVSDLGWLTGCDRSMEFFTFSEVLPRVPLPMCSPTWLPRPRQVISALNIPLSVMMAPLLACRLVSLMMLNFWHCVNRVSDSGPEGTRCGDGLPLGGDRCWRVRNQIWGDHFVQRPTPREAWGAWDTSPWPRIDYCLEYHAKHHWEHPT